MTDARDYRDTVFLPKTSFPMRAGLPAKEPQFLEKWETGRLYQQIRAARAGRDTFILHDGPPYANGDMHIGHALNHILKDMVVRTQTLLGKDAPYVPGWDCHGLPIEWKVEENYRKKKLNKDDVPPKEFRAECRAYARHWVNVQKGQLKRLGISADWDNPYLTMDFDAEATIVTELLKFAASGQLYRGAKPVMWSPVEKTALADAEVEYADIVSTQVDIAFEITDSPVRELIGAYAVIWTTTPWTIPVNQALAYGPDIEYHHYRAPDGRRFLIAADLLEAFFARTGLGPVAEDVTGDFNLSEYALGTYRGADLAGTSARHPMHALGGFFARPRPFLAGDFVTTDSGTGLVHMAPDHGEDDFALCKSRGIGPVFAVEDDGRYRADWLWLGGAGSVINPKFNAPDGPVCHDLREAGALLSASADYHHSYPHSWRSKAKVIFRCTPQWFVPMDRRGILEHADTPSEQRWEDEGGSLEPSPTLRELALQSLANTRFIPEKGRRRITAMVQDRPDWVLSRQRAWGVPITLFVNRKSGQYLVDEQVNERIIAAIAKDGVDAWCDENAADLLGPQHDVADYERVTDILDVWFDSGSTHAFVLESGRWEGLRWPADLYLEGSDQHRGWFQSSLLESCATRGRAPYNAVLTHGFTMDARGEKMSKSKGNTVNPVKLMERYGADIIRLWALSVDFTEDHRIGDEILKGIADQYRKLRNTFRYLLGALEGFSKAERLSTSDMPELERYILTLLGRLDQTLRSAVEACDFNTYVRALVDFCNDDLSAFFFDIRKDALYCDAPDSLRRRAYRTTLDTLFHALVRYMAPVLVFTAEEVWQTRYAEAGSVHLLEWPEVPDISADVEQWSALRDLRDKVNEAIEPLRRDKVLGSGLEAQVTIPKGTTDLSEDTLAELLITGRVLLTETEAISVTRTDDHKCGRCWRHLPEVTNDGDLCPRCDSAVSASEHAG